MSKKAYIIIGTFFNMGGGQLYTRNKVDYLKKNGWHVFLYTGRTGKLLIPELEEYRGNFIKALNEFPFFAGTSKREEIIRRIVDDCSGDWSEIIIESSKLPFAFWGELIAERLKARHVFFCLDETFPVYAKWYYEYMLFKYDRHELACITKPTMLKMFKPYIDLEGRELYSLNFVCQNSFVEYCHREIDSAKLMDLNIGVISRLDKGYIIPLIEEIVKWAHQNSNVLIALFIIGDANDSKIKERIKFLCGREMNITVYFFGYVSPIPKSLLSKVDVFFGTSGSSHMTANAGKITVALDTVSGTPIGILNYDNITTSVYSEAEQNRTVPDYLDQLSDENNRHMIEALIREKLKSLPSRDYMTEFDNHMRFIDAAKSPIEYYKFRFPLYTKIVPLLVSIFGIETLRKIKHIPGTVNFYIRKLAKFS